MLFILASCANTETRKRIYCEYPGAIILQNYGFKKSGLSNETYAILYKGETIPYVSVYDIDAGLKAGDTINKPCLTTK